MDPVTTWSIAKAAGEIATKLYNFGKSLKDREQKREIDEISDEVRDLKQAASKLEDENRELREKLRFKSDAFEFPHALLVREDESEDRPLREVPRPKHSRADGRARSPVRP